MHPFFWRPAEGARHATLQRPTPGESVTTLCGSTVALPEPTDVAWLWATCPDCNAVAHRVAASRSSAWELAPRTTTAPKRASRGSAP